MKTFAIVTACITVIATLLILLAIAARLGNIETYLFEIRERPISQVNERSDPGTHFGTP